MERESSWEKGMSTEKIEFPIHDDVFIHLKDALLFVNGEGNILKRK